jgi:putative membrane protein
MSNVNEANLYFSAERTMLSWQRSALAFIALGFALERYAFMKNIDLPNHINSIHYLISVFVGLSFILLGAFIAFQSAVHHKRLIRSLPLEELPTHYFYAMGPIAGYIIAVGGILLIIWIVLGTFNL